MDDFILFLSCGPFPPETKSSLGGKRHTARIQAVSDEPSEELRQGEPSLDNSLAHGLIQYISSKLVRARKSNDTCTPARICPRSTGKAY